MQKEEIPAEIKANFLKILSLDQEAQKLAIENIYDEDCLLENPYLVSHFLSLSGRNEIVRSYATLSKNNMELLVTIESVTYDPVQQKVMADVEQILRPKALGGVMSIKMHVILKLQLEQSNDQLYRIVKHNEIPVTQDLISQMPILGNWYESTIRNAVGQISMAGTSILDYTGFLDFAPKAVDVTKKSATSLKNTAGSIVSGAARMGIGAVQATGVPHLFSGVLETAKWGAASLIEEGSSIKIDCYSPSCAPGSICYSPTCPRAQHYAFLTTKALQDIIKGAYTGAEKRFLRPKE